MNNVVTIREFTRNIYKYLKLGGEFVVTIRGKEAIVVTIFRNNVVTNKENVVTKPKSTPIVTISKKESPEISGNVIQRYSCGCIKGETKLCLKHHRA